MARTLPEQAFPPLACLVPGRSWWSTTTTSITSATSLSGSQCRKEVFLGRWEVNCWIPVVMDRA